MRSHRGLSFALLILAACSPNIQATRLKERDFQDAERETAQAQSDLEASTTAHAEAVQRAEAAVQLLRAQGAAAEAAANLLLAQLEATRLGAFAAAGQAQAHAEAAKARTDAGNVETGKAATKAGASSEHSSSNKVLQAAIDGQDEGESWYLMPHTAHHRPVTKTDEHGKAYAYSSQFEASKHRNFHKMSEKYMDFYKTLGADPIARYWAKFGVAVFLIAPWLLYWIFWWVLWRLTAQTRNAMPEAWESTVSMFKTLIFLLAVAAGGQIAVRCVDWTGGHFRWIQVEIETALSNLSVMCIGWGMSRIFIFFHAQIERNLMTQVDDDYSIRHEFMTKVSHPTHVEPLPDDCRSQEEVIFKFVWMPFYIYTQSSIFAGVFMIIAGYTMSWYLIGVLYIGMAVVASVFGSRTLGPDIYGGIVLLLEKHMQIGDIVSVEDRGNAGGCESTLITGFVERISLRSTTIRRFDMRACLIPNSLFSKHMLSNWKRPRKLIYMELGISHRTPLVAIERFSTEVRAMINNHPDVDRELYTKAVFANLNKGYMFRVVCFNAQKTKKQFVQQDIIFRISTIAQRLGIVITFDEKSISVQGESVQCHYMSESDINAGVDVSDLVPKRRQNEEHIKVAPDGYLLVRVETGSCIDGLPDKLRLASRIFVKVTLDPEHSDHQSQSTDSQIITQQDSQDFKWLQTLAFKHDSTCAKVISCKAKIELYVAGTQMRDQLWVKPHCVGEAHMDLSTMGDNSQATDVIIHAKIKGASQNTFAPGSLGAAASLTGNRVLTVGIKVFVAPNLSFDVPELPKVVEQMAASEDEGEGDTAWVPTSRGRGRLSNVGTFAHAKSMRPSNTSNSKASAEQLCRQLSVDSNMD